MNTATDTLKNRRPLSSGGCEEGQSATDKLGFYGATPIVQPTASAQAAVTDTGGGTAAPTTGVTTITGTYNSVILANAFSTVIAQGNALRLALVNLGLIKGS